MDVFGGQRNTTMSPVLGSLIFNKFFIQDRPSQTVIKFIDDDEITHM